MKIYIMRRADSVVSMQIIKKSLKEGEVVLRIDSAEDLWYLSQLVSPGDVASGKTERKIKLGGSEEKSSVVKKSVFISIDVERVEFHRHSDSLRLMGTVADGPEDIPRGSHHTLSVEPGIIITITKPDGWPGYQLDRLKEAAEAARHTILVVVFDREDAIFAVLKGQGHEILAKLRGSVSKKSVDNSETKNFYAEIAAAIRDYDKRLKPHNIILASPSFWKEYLMKEIREPELKKKVALASCSDVEEGSIAEVMKRPEVSRVLESDRAAKELSLVDELLKAISKEEACYGLKECRAKLNLGAVKEMLVAYSFLNKSREEGKGREAEQLLKDCEQKGGKVHVLSTEAAEKKVAGLGGVAGILRWKGA